jgi:DNA-binding NarL/FixJ family response regulator
MQAAVAAGLERVLERLGASLDEVLKAFPATVTLLDVNGTVVWQNERSRARVGDRRGASFLGTIAAEHRHMAENAFLRLRFKPESSSVRELVVVDADGRRKRSIAVSSAVRGTRGEVVGVLSIAIPLNSDDGPAPRLSPRQLETLELLTAGLSTREIAAELGVTLETARNYIRRLLKSLGAHSRVEAVARGRLLHVLAGPGGSSGDSPGVSSVEESTA